MLAEYIAKMRLNEKEKKKQQPNITCMPGPLYMYLIEDSPALVKLHDEIVGSKNEGSVCHPSWIILHETVIPAFFVTLKHYSE